MLNLDIQHYIQQNILPLYQNFDKGHQQNHAQKVIEESLILARQYAADENMAYVIAAYHDIGLSKDRERHHLHSGEMLQNDPTLRRWFSEEQIAVMREAVEDHRASSKHAPRSIYGAIVAEADRHIDPETILRRTIQYGLEKYPESSQEQHFERAITHLNEKYGRGGYLKLWLKSAKNEQGLESVRVILEQPAELQAMLERIWREEVAAIR